ncbi:zinc-binding alcohol dehydrogenase family protein [Pelagovum pacificum]|uniref:Zinc-binding alcohol dehydrogenase family protein n=1 Tax=Pelagovum pacificum TaxID=2588711 RepID=A0A5C5GD01_9RHOB|nr:zinc-binding alcohol dehydrogenase family protein [Pelagovum pacificum]TNY32548.1 zinc-binding alcohol dehydrogenase family protein [Pelagovum pacificum]
MGLVTETMASGVCEAPGRFTVSERPVPGPAPDGWVTVDIGAVGLCGTDYHIYEGKHPYLDYPRVIGHELSGTITSGADAGQLVVVNPYISCGHCRACNKGRPNCCASLEVLGVHRDGGMCRTITVPRGNLYAADGLDAHQAAMVEFLSIGAHGVSRAPIGPGDRVLVTGAGPIGLGVALFARMTGAEVHLTDTSDRRLQFAGTRLGFSNLHRAEDKIVTGALSDGFDVVFDATGSVRAIERGFSMVAQGGATVLLSVVKDEIRFSDAEFHRRETQIIGSRNALKRDFDAVMEAMRTGEISTDTLLSEVIPLGDLPKRLPELVQSREDIVKVLVTP